MGVGVWFPTRTHLEPPHLCHNTLHPKFFYIYSELQINYKNFKFLFIDATALPHALITNEFFY